MKHAAQLAMVDILQVCEHEEHGPTAGVDSKSTKRKCWHEAVRVVLHAGVRA